MTHSSTPAVGKPAPQFCIIAITDSVKDMDALSQACENLRMKVWLIGLPEDKQQKNITSFRVEYTNPKELFNLGIAFQSLKQQ